MLGIAVIGAGRIGRIHASNLHANPKSRVVYVSDVRAAAADDLAAQCQAKTADVDTCLDDTAVDAVVIASSTDTHAALIERAAAAGKPIFCEKPLDLETDTARKSVAAAAAAGVPLCIGFNRRHDPTFDEIHRQVSGGHIGNVEVVTIISRDPAPPPIEYVRRSGGLFRDMMIHDFDMARWLLGEEPVDVFAFGSVLVDSKIAAAGDVDSAIAVLRTASGRLCHITNSRRCSYGYDQRIEVFGAKGRVSTDNHTRTTVQLADASGERREPALPFFLERYSDAYRLQLEKFLCLLEGQVVSLPDGQDGLRALEIADAAQLSADTARPVALDSKKNSNVLHD